MWVGVQVALLSSVIVLIVVGVIGCMLWTLSIFWACLMGDFIERSRRIKEYQRKLKEED